MSSSRLRLFLLFIALACATYTATAWGVDFLKPTMENVSYGPHEAQKLDFYQAHSDKPTPLVFMIHGGGWVNGDKGSFNDAGKYTAAGISVVSINYRFIAQARADKLVPPVRGPLYDAARALQFVRFKSGEWNIDKARIGLTGSSAGACTSLWIAFHADLADPQNADPVLRESTRVWCAGVMRAQTSLDPEQMVKWIPNTTYGAHAFAGGESEANAKGFAAFLQRRAELLPMINEFSPYALAEAGAPPIFMSYETAPAMGEPQGNPTHSANFGVGLAEKLQALGWSTSCITPAARQPSTKTFTISWWTSLPNGPANNMTLPITGGCFCGAVRFECTAEPIFMLRCHCRDCQQVSGGPYAPAVIFPYSAFRLSKGELRRYATGHNLRGFCAECGSRLTGAESPERGIMGVTASALDDPGIFQPSCDVYAEDAQAWDVPDPSVKIYPGPMPRSS